MFYGYLLLYIEGKTGDIVLKVYYCHAHKKLLAMSHGHNECTNRQTKHLSSAGQ